MTATLLTFPPPRPPNTGNGALELVRHYFSDVHTPGLGAAGPVGAELSDGDYFLAWLANEGFVIVPIGDVM